MKQKTNLPFTVGKWITNHTVEDEVVISSRVRLARNLDNYIFPSWLKAKESQAINSKIIKNVLDDPKLKKLYVLSFNELTDIEKQILFEENLVSSNFLDESQLEKSIILSKDANLGIMVNEEDHLRIQAVFPGLQLIKAWNRANEVDNQLNMKMKFAFSERWGFLTSCPSNIGTALRVSVMMHLPALIFNNQVDQMINSLTKMGIVFRGLFGEGSVGCGNIFQISNQTTLGKSEEEIIENLNCLSIQLIEKEKTARKILLRDSKLKVSDRAKRAIGILNHAEMLGLEETLELLSMVRLGLDLGLIEGIKIKKINELFYLVRPGHIKFDSKKELTDQEISIKRAALVKKLLNM